ncbi:MAG: hypothetical protein K0S44_3349 [Bacteroidetes bacterium]|jgi:hypothetical protein|nr:hypothetical protein [Bacteroidota bacterium]
MKTQVLLGSSPGVKADTNQNNVNDYFNTEECGQADTQQSVENDDSDNWYNESSI